MTSQYSPQGMMAYESPSVRTNAYGMRLNQDHGFNHNRNGQRHWSTFTFVQLKIKHLPLGVTTFQIFENFRRYGDVSKINIYDRKEDQKGTTADLYFEPPPRYPFWERGKVNFFWKHESTINSKIVRVEFSDRPPANFKVESPVNRGVEYDEKIVLTADSLTWGVLTEPEKMMTMVATSEGEHRTILVLNLRRREIELQFPFTFRSDNRVAVRTFRFIIGLNEDFTIWKLPDRGYVLHLLNIPWYSKQLKEAIKQTHSTDGNYWSIEDTWARQTDIFEHKSHFEMINGLPISLQKKMNSINIARWTTFLVNLSDTEDNHVAERVFRNALKDFNADIRNGKDFSFAPSSSHSDIQAWELLNGQQRNEKPISLEEEMSTSTLSFAVRYQLEVCLSHGWLSEYQIGSQFLQDLAATEETIARQMLVYVDSYQQRVWDPMTLFSDLRYRRPLKERILPEHCIEICSATVTATSILWHTPTVEVTNRIIRRHRHHADRFLRVRFEDDAYRGQTRLYPASNNKMILIFQRVRRTLLRGIQLGDRLYEFLAWGNSQLRDHGAYFFAGIDDLTASKIRSEMGAFDDERVVAKRAARMGQCFSTTKPVHLRLPAITPKNTIPDIRQGKYVFTDGVGKISPLAAQLVHQQLRIKGPVPSVYQFRLGGCKGVLTVWPELTSVDVQVRASQFKFDSSSGELEIIRCSEFWQPFLNRQIIMCLSSLGVPTEIFLMKQEKTIQALDAAMNDDRAAIRALRDNVDPNQMTLSMAGLVDAGFRASKEPFVTSILRLWKAWSLKYLKEKAKIPVTDGAFVLGCVDETNTLRGHFDKLQPSQASKEEKIKTIPEIFIQVTDPQTSQRKIIEGVCVLARNPSLHRGDIRVVKAIDVPALRHLCDVVVMPANGDRDLPSMCSGGDLDGDDYMVIWDEVLIPETWNVEPFHYEPPPPKMAQNITTEDMVNFFYDYLQNDHLGRIAHAHLAAADWLDEGLESQTCLDLVQLHSMAVDYPKTGVPAIMERRLERTRWPHFMEKKGGKYTSHTVLGKLYDAVERVSFSPTFDLPFDKRILNADRPTEEMLLAISHVKQDYDNSLQRIMAQHNIKTEFEVWSTFVIDHSKASRDFKFHEEIGNLSSTLKEQYHDRLCELAGGRDFEHLAPVASAAYQYTHAMVQTALREVDDGLRYGGNEGMPFISFPWVLKDTLCMLAHNSLTIEQGSAAIVEDGILKSVDSITEYDQQGRAKIRVRDSYDVDLEGQMLFSGHLPDPYQPPKSHDPNPDDLIRSEQIREDDTGGSEAEVNSASAVVTMLDVAEFEADNRVHQGQELKSLSQNIEQQDSVELPLVKEIDSHLDNSIPIFNSQSPASTVPGNTRSSEGSIDSNNAEQYLQSTKSLAEEKWNLPPLTSQLGHELSKNDAHMNKSSEVPTPFVMDDPLNMTAEQLEAMGLNLDMEL